MSETETMNGAEALSAAAALVTTGKAGVEDVLREPLAKVLRKAKNLASVNRGEEYARDEIALARAIVAEALAADR